MPGDYAFRVKANKGVDPWDVQVSSPVAGAIIQGDVIMLDYFARAEQPADGGSSLTARIQLAVFNFGKGYDTAKLRFCDG